MPDITVPIGTEGAIVRLLVSVSQPRAEILEEVGIPIPDPIAIHALVDTGAYATCIDPKALEPLHLGPTGRAEITTPSTGDTPHLSQQYDVRLTISHPDGDLILDVPVLEAISKSAWRCWLSCQDHPERTPSRENSHKEVSWRKDRK